MFFTKTYLYVLKEDTHVFKKKSQWLFFMFLVGLTFVLTRTDWDQLKNKKNIT